MHEPHVTKDEVRRYQRDGFGMPPIEVIEAERMHPFGTPLEIWTVARFPNGEWTTGGSPTSSDYHGCEVFQVEATGRKDAKRRAQQERRRKGYVPCILKAPVP